MGGFRLEDTIHITADGPDNLSPFARTAQQIEKLIAEGRANQAKPEPKSKSKATPNLAASSQAKAPPPRAAQV